MINPDNAPNGGPLNAAVDNPPPGAAVIEEIPVVQDIPQANNVIPDSSLASIMQAIQAMQENMNSSLTAMTAEMTANKAELQGDLSTKLQPIQDFHNQIQGMARALSGQPDVSENTGVPTMGGGGNALTPAGTPREPKYGVNTENSRLDNLISGQNVVRNEELNIPTVNPRNNLFQTNKNSVPVKVLTYDCRGAENGLIVKTWVPTIINNPGREFHGQIMMTPEHDSIKERGAHQLNLINMFEENITGDDAEWLRSLAIIRNRESLVSSDDQGKRYEQRNKYDNVFVTQVPTFTKADKDKFSTYIEKIWEVGCRQYIDGHQFMKNQLFNQVSPVYPEICSEDMKPGCDKMIGLTFKAYAVKLMLKFQPSNQKEIAKANFEAMGQHRRTIDSYFDEKLKLFHIAYGRYPTELDYHAFFKQFHRRMESKELAKIMANETRTLDMKKPDISSYRTQLLKGAQQILDGVQDGYYRADDARGCKSLSYALLTSRDSRQTAKGYNRGSENNPITIAQIGQNRGRPKDNEYLLEEVSESDEEYSDSEAESDPEDDDTDKLHELQIMALNDKRNQKNPDMKCYFCGKMGHSMTHCWDREKGRSPHPLGVYAQREKERKERNQAGGATPKPFIKRTKANPKKGFRKGKMDRKIQQLDEDRDEKDSNATSTEHEDFLNSINDLGFLPSPLGDYEN